jgi:Protein of unknown function (DUF2281)
MTIRETTIAKLQQLPEPLLQQVNDFIDRLMPHSEPGNSKPEDAIAGTWAHWFEAGDRLEIAPTESTSDYQQLLLSKYRQQGLEL